MSKHSSVAMRHQRWRYVWSVGLEVNAPFEGKGKRGAKVPSDREGRERERERGALQKALKHRRTVVFAHGRNGSLDCRSMLLLHKNTWAHATPLLPLVYSSPLQRGGEGADRAEISRANTAPRRRRERGIEGRK